MGAGNLLPTCPIIIFMKPQEKKGCLIGIGLLVLYCILTYLSMKFDSPILKTISFGIPGFVSSYVLGKYFGIKDFQWKPKEIYLLSCSDS